MLKEQFINEEFLTEEEIIEMIKTELELIESGKPFGDLKKGAFKKWCKQQGLMDKDSDDVPCKCVKAGLKSDNKHVVKMASFAKGIGGNC